MDKDYTEFKQISPLDFLERMKNDNARVVEELNKNVNFGVKVAKNNRLRIFTDPTQFGTKIRKERRDDFAIAYHAWKKTENHGELPEYVRNSPEGSITRFFYALVTSTTFESFIFILILLNTVSLALEWP